MSVQGGKKRRSVPAIKQMKQLGEKIVSLTCYDYTTARILEDTPIDLLLVGDSLAMTVLGYDDTLSITMDEMLHHVKAVTRGAKTNLVVADMPFMSYQVNKPTAISNAGRFIKEGGAQAVKIEGATDLVLDTIAHLNEIGIPVMGHLGLTPQSVNTLGGYKVQGKTEAIATQLMKDALALQEAGVFALVLEMVPVEVAHWITKALDIPTIGIGAGNGCDGQILVVDDLLGRYSDLSPRFVRQYLDSQKLVKQAVTCYAADVQAGHFPHNTSEAFPASPELIAQLNSLISTHQTPAMPPSVRERQVDLMSFPSKANPSQVKQGEHVSEERATVLPKQLASEPTPEELEQRELSNLMDELVKPVG